jgi:hypothetical protein
MSSDRSGHLVLLAGSPTVLGVSCDARRDSALKRALASIAASIAVALLTTTGARAGTAAVGSSSCLVYGNDSNPGGGNVVLALSTKGTVPPAKGFPGSECAYVTRFLNGPKGIDLFWRWTSTSVRIQVLGAHFRYVWRPYSQVLPLICTLSKDGGIWRVYDSGTYGYGTELCRWLAS